MKLYNPTEKEVFIVVDGVAYTIAPSGTSKELSDEVFKRWVNTHEFLLPVDTDTTITSEPVVDTNTGDTAIEEPIKPVKAKK